MKTLTGQQLRQLWDKFWQSKQHKYLSEVSLIADKESTAMFNVAGMQQLIPYLMGKPHDLGKRVYNIQKCIRTVDIDEVGDASHLTFFTMMGNWSLGDYFKKEAVEWSWEFLTSEEYLGINPKKLAVSVFKGDENAPQDNETASYWLDVWVSQDKISYLPAKNNRRSPGPVGPCGPDTEIFYRIGDGEYPPVESNVETDDDNWLEIWNDVFMEYYRDEQGILTKLKQQNVDTWMGFERMCKVLQNKETIYESDLFQTIISFIEKNTRLKYQDNQRRMRIIADHLRTAVMLISDGCITSNVWAGYVLRMIIRRMYYNLILLNNNIDDWYHSLFNEVIDFVASQYKLNKKEIILKGLEDELHQFKKL
jgi:alanyl-tRNA synthetase